MIRKTVIVMLTLAALGALAAMLVSYTSIASLNYYDANRFTWYTLAAAGGELSMRCESEVGSFSTEAGPGNYEYAFSGGQLVLTLPWGDRTRELRYRSFTGRVWYRAVPGWTSGIVMALFAAYPCLAFVRGPYRRWRRRQKDLCLSCGYNLTGNVSGICPECGTEIKPP